MSSKLDHRELNLLIKLCGMLGSSNDGERSNAALKASELLRRYKLTWQELFGQFVHGTYLSAPQTAAPSNQPRHRPRRKVHQSKFQRATHDQYVTWTGLIAECRKRVSRLSPWDHENLAGMEAKLGLGLALTHTQQQRLTNLRAKLHR